MEGGGGATSLPVLLCRGLIKTRRRRGVEELRRHILTGSLVFDSVEKPETGFSHGPKKHRKKKLTPNDPLNAHKSIRYGVCRAGYCTLSTHGLCVNDVQPRVTARRSPGKYLLTPWKGAHLSLSLSPSRQDPLSITLGPVSRTFHSGGRRSTASTTARMSCV